MTSTRPSGLQDYSDEAQVEHTKREQQYGAALEQVSRLIARQKNADDVQKSHVDDAAEALGTGSKKLRILSEVGVLIAGAGIGYLGNVMIGNAFTAKNVFIFMLPILIGCCMYAYSAGRK